jgi:hypothetical protein
MRSCAGNRGGHRSSDNAATEKERKGRNSAAHYHAHNSHHCHLSSKLLRGGTKQDRAEEEDEEVGLDLLELECVGDSGAARLALSPASSASRHRPPGCHHHEIPFETKPSRIAVEDDSLHLTPSPAADAAALISNTTYVRSRESAQSSPEILSRPAWHDPGLRRHGSVKAGPTQHDNSCVPCRASLLPEPTAHNMACQL